MRARLALVLPLLLVTSLASTAVAGTEAAPEVRDARGDQSNPEVDLISAWLTNEHDGLRFTLKLAGFDDGHPTEASYYIVFNLGNARRVAYVYFNEDGQPQAILDEPGFGSKYPGGASTWPRNMGDVNAYATDAAAYVDALIPWGATTGFEPGRDIVLLITAADDTNTPNRRGGDYDDLANTQVVFTLERGPAPSRTADALVQAPLGLTLLGTTLLGGAVAFVLARPHVGHDEREGADEPTPPGPPAPPTGPAARDVRPPRLRPPT